MMDNRYIGELSTDVYGVSINEMRIGHIHLTADQATKADIDGLLEAVGSGDDPIAWVASYATLTNSLADTLTIKAPAMMGAYPNAKVKFLIATNGKDELEVKVGTGSNINRVTVSVAKTTAAKNTGALIQAAIRALGAVADVDLSGFTCTPSAQWNARTIAAEASPTAQAMASGATGTSVLYTPEEDLGDMPYPRSVTATSDGTAGDIANVAVTVYGTNMRGEAISEQLPYFTAGSATTVESLKIFKSVTAVDIPAHADSAATTEIGFGDKIGLPLKLRYKPLSFVTLDGVLEATAPTFTLNKDRVELNSIELDSDLDDKEVEIFLVL